MLNGISLVDRRQPSVRKTAKGSRDCQQRSGANPGTPDINARMEGFNDIFKAARARARGYRNAETFITIIYLIAAPLGKLFNSI